MPIELVRYRVSGNKGDDFFSRELSGAVEALIYGLYKRMRGYAVNCDEIVVKTYLK